MSGTGIVSFRDATSAVRLLGLAALVLVCMSGCAPGSLANAVTRAPTLRGSEACRAGRINSSPLVVEWSASERAQFEGLAKDGPIVVRYTGCTFDVLTQCRAPGGYHYVALTPKSDSEKIENADELRVKIPLGSARLQSEFKQAGQIAVDTTIVGRYQVDHSDIRESALVGRCLGATHVVTGLTVGAFELTSAAAGSVTGDASVLQFGTDGGSKTSRKMLARDGDMKACVPPRPDVSSPAPPQSLPPSPSPLPSDPEPPVQAPIVVAPPAPPKGCGALVRVDLAPLPEAEVRYAAEDQRRRDDLAARRAAATTRRTWGWVLSSAGVAGLGGAGAFGLLGASNNSDIQAGGYANAQAIKDAESAGTTYNTTAYALTAAGAALVGIGAALIILSPNPDAEHELGDLDGEGRKVGKATESRSR